MASSMPAAVVKPAIVESELKIADVADALNVCTRTVRRLIATGELEARRYGHRTVRIPASSVEAFRESHRIPTVRREWSDPIPPRRTRADWREVDPTGNKAARKVTKDDPEGFKQRTRAAVAELAAARRASGDADA